MKLILIITASFFLGSFNIQETPADFEYKLSKIVQDFRSEIMNEEECEKQKRAADELADEIEDALESEEYDSDEIIELKKLKKEAEAIEIFIDVIGGLNNYDLKLTDFNLANRRVNANVSYAISNRYCVDIKLVTINDYVIYLAENNSSKRYRISYNWKANNGMNSGSGEMGLWKSSMRHIHENREDVSLKNLSFNKITCKEF